MEKGEYRRRDPEKTVLYQVVRENLNTFLEYADARSADGRSLPVYVRQARVTPSVKPERPTGPPLSGAEPGLDVPLPQVR